MTIEKTCHLQKLEEIASLKKQIANLEAILKEHINDLAQANVPEDQQVQRLERQSIDANIEFIGDFDIIAAKGVDISEGGICFDVSECLPFEMQFSMQEKKHRYSAKLAWMKRRPQGGYRFGFEFLPYCNTPEI